jgi:CRP-like cAMP-binding protein/predicted MFS family arabinose efflux permease
MASHGPALLAVALAGLTSLSQTPYLPSVAAVIPQVTAEEDLAAANALNSTVDNLVVVLGPAIGAVLLLIGGATMATAANALSFLIAIPFVLAIRTRSQPTDVTDDGEAGPFQQMVVGFRAVVSSTTVAVFVAFSVLASFIYGTDTVLFIPIARVQLHSGASGYGYLLAGLGAGGLVGAVFINRLAANPRLTAPILGGMAVYCVPTAILITVHQPVVAFLLEVVRGAGTLIVDTLAFTALQRSVAPEMVARVFGVFFALILAAIALGAMITPVLLSAGLHTTMLVYGLLVPALCMLSLTRLSALDRAAVQRAAAIAPRISILERLDLFAAASRASLEALASSAEEIEVPAKTAVVEEGAVADAFYAVVSGTLAVSAIGEKGGKRKQLRTLEADSYFGEIGLIARIPRTATVRATTNCTLLRIDGDAFIDALTTMSVSSSLLTGARQRLRRTHPSSPALNDAGLPAGVPV